MNGSYLNGLKFMAVLCLAIVRLTTLTVHADTRLVDNIGGNVQREVDLSYSYAINLEPTLAKRSKPPIMDAFKRYRLYSIPLKHKGKLWYQLRLGFFPTKQAAQKVLNSLNEAFPMAWVIKVSMQERKRLAQPTIDTASITPAYEPVQSKQPTSKQVDEPVQDKLLTSKQVDEPVQGKQPTSEQVDEPVQGKQLTSEQVDEPVQSKQPTSKQVPEERLEKIMGEAKEAMTRGDHRRAIQIYTKILQYPEDKNWQEAQELLGLARERNGQMAHAKAEYRKYLRLFPDGEGATRVRQRLAGLVTAKASPKEKLRNAKNKKDGVKWQKMVYGSFSQFYSRDERFTATEGGTVNQSVLNSTLFVNSRLRSAEYDLSTRFSGGYEKDFLDNDNSETRISTLYIDVFDRRRSLSGRIGRQSFNAGGVLGRFDGGVFDFKIFPQVKVNVVGGFPVDVSTTENINKNKKFYGLSLDIETSAQHWDFKPFIIHQEVNGITDREAVGGEIRYFHSKGFIFSLVDYDIFFDDLNMVLFRSNWIFASKARLNISYDYRNSPILTTSNALYGQNVDSISELLDSLGETEVQKLAQDRTSTSNSITLGASRPLTEKWQLGGDVMLSEWTGTKASGGVEAMPGTGIEYFYSTQLIGSNLIKEGNIATVRLSYSDTSTSDTISMNLNTRYPLNRSWRINPRLRVDSRNNKRNDGEMLKSRTSLRMDYRWKKRIRFELEAVWEWVKDTLPYQTDKTNGYFFTVGHRIDF